MANKKINQVISEVIINDNCQAIHRNGEKVAVIMSWPRYQFLRMQVNQAKALLRGGDANTMALIQLLEQNGETGLAEEVRILDSKAQNRDMTFEEAQARTNSIMAQLLDLTEGTFVSTLREDPDEALKKLTGD